MMKAYDLKDLVEKLKVAGLPVAEEAAEQVVKVVFAWAEESADISESKIDDMFKPILPMAREFILSKIEKIDGQ